ncbi:MAG TPA: histone deacetylase [Vicinamibacterales bacterium]|jgi:acetoin utilization deacetylase AcuC-like enzyme|nr:histone deacetylase [Vicinamibacterales bacterium]
MSDRALPIVYSPRYHIDIGHHVFPTEKYGRVRAALDAMPFRCELIEPEPASWDDLALVHTREYLTKMRTGTLAPTEIAELELPWSEEMVFGFRVMVGGTIAAARVACRNDLTPDAPHARSHHPSSDSLARRALKVVCHVGGGLHHAFANHGEGFCPFNDVAVAVRMLQAHGLERVSIVDLDVHHGNGTSFIFESDPRVFTFSMHQQHNYPVFKPRSALDIGLADGAHDETYLHALEGALPKVLASNPQCIFYLAGADPYEDDLLGGLRLTKDGLRRRDRMVLDAAASVRVPLVVTLAGGYARNVDDVVAIHVATIEEAAAVAGRFD